MSCTSCNTKGTAWLARTLAIIPGFGGTQLLPRLVGLSKAIEMMLLSKSIMSEEGKNSGLIDKLGSPEELLNVSRLWALDIAERRKPLLRTLHRTDKLGSLSEAREVLKMARQQAKQVARNMPQHQACLDAIEEGVVHGAYSGVLRQNFPRTLEALILHVLSPVGAQVLTRKFEEMDQLINEVDRSQFYQIFYGVFDNQFAAMDALLNAKESFAHQAFKNVLDQYLGVHFDGSNPLVERGTNFAGFSKEIGP